MQSERININGSRYFQRDDRHVQIAMDVPYMGPNGPQIRQVPVFVAGTFSSRRAAKRWIRSVMGSAVG